MPSCKSGACELEELKGVTPYKYTHKSLGGNYNLISSPVIWPAPAVCSNSLKPSTKGAPSSDPLSRRAFLHISVLNVLRYPYITHIFCNAGVGAFDGMDWPKAIKQILRNPVEATTYPCYKIQKKGLLSEDRLGWVWQCNVFGHYLMVSGIPPPRVVHVEPLIMSVSSRFAIL